LTPFLAVMCIFPLPTTFVTRVFLVDTQKMDFTFY
jgi:hypothetical protein